MEEAEKGKNKPKLEFDFIPEESWKFNLRHILSPAAWDVVRRDAYKQANYKCRICGRGNCRLEAHETAHSETRRHTCLVPRMPCRDSLSAHGALRRCGRRGPRPGAFYARERMHAGGVSRSAGKSGAKTSRTQRNRGLAAGPFIPETIRLSARSLQRSGYGKRAEICIPARYFRISAKKKKNFLFPILKTSKKRGIIYMIGNRARAIGFIPNND